MYCRIAQKHNQFGEWYRAQNLCWNTIYNMEGCVFLAVIASTVFFGNNFHYFVTSMEQSKCKMVGDKIMSHSTMVHRGLDLQPQFQATKAGKSVEHICSTVHLGSRTEDRMLGLSVVAWL
jgi:hypothetical protein